MLKIIYIVVFQIIFYVFNLNAISSDIEAGKTIIELQARIERAYTNYNLALNKSLGCSFCASIKNFCNTKKSKHVQKRKQESEIFYEKFKDIKNFKEYDQIINLKTFLKPLENSKKGGHCGIFYDNCMDAINVYLKSFKLNISSL